LNINFRSTEQLKFLNSSTNITDLQSKTLSKTHDSKVRHILQTVLDLIHKLESTIGQHLSDPFGHLGRGITVPHSKNEILISIVPLQLFAT